MPGPSRRQLLAALATLPAAPAQAQALPPVAQPPMAQPLTWRPDRPLRLVLPFSPGGLTDILTRSLAPLLAARLGQTAVVENRAGAAGNLAADAVVKAPADGHALLIATQGIIAMNPALFSALPYDPDADLVPLGMLGRQPNLLVVSPRVLPEGGIPELLAAARQKPGGLSYGSNGVGSFTHLSMALFASMAGVPMTHVPYRGSAPMLADLVAGTLDCAFDALGTSAPQVREGTLRALAVSSATRSPALPDLPAVAESLPGFAATPWYGVFGTTRTPAPVLAALEAAVQGVLADPAWAAVLAARQVDAYPGDRATLAAEIAAERAQWRAIVRTTGARAD
ncbi:tripartite-type tricarboxylate transporter receptor subunit TctC [Humitalea rosea]|uniref:Tripartite-type tricarboxylate transporter receptor subunit TctC n=1 Tax=Humitalea rosea TaxID=990373 RepID=A0A2W7I6P2_9PROT|nr:tripartite tricarboxylate transporter substrate-binding protein [Humitalea rosea]PZW40815.1 tripartite-type tricarboxylate transporter receptor subunit TctC [Humitalea rosea]